MANQPHVHVGNTLLYKLRFMDNGTPADLTGCLVKSIIVTSPSGAKKITKTGADVTFETDGSDGIIRTLLSGTDFDEPGFWKFQGYYQMDSTHKYNSEVRSLWVYPNL